MPRSTQTYISMSKVPILYRKYTSEIIRYGQKTKIGQSRVCRQNDYIVLCHYQQLNHKGKGEKTNNCNKCNYASIQAGHLTPPYDEKTLLKSENIFSKYFTSFLDAAGVQMIVF